MKKFLIYFILLTFSGSVAFSQMPPESKPDMELTKDEAVLRIQDWTQRVKELENKLATAEQDLAKLQNDLQEAKNNLKDCQEALLALLEATNMDIEKFRQALGVIEGKVRQMKGYSNDKLADMRDDVVKLENDLNELRKNKLALLPEFYNKILELARDIKGLYREKKIKSYTVGTWSEDRDCLWNIAGKLEIYGDPSLWPKIWQNNKDIIRNPDIIHPGQVLTLPQKGPKDAAELKAERKYWRKKRDAMEAEATTTPEPSKGE